MLPTELNTLTIKTNDACSCNTIAHQDQHGLGTHINPGAMQKNLDSQVSLGLGSSASHSFALLWCTGRCIHRHPASRNARASSPRQPGIGCLCSIRCHHHAASCTQGRLQLEGLHVGVCWGVMVGVRQGSRFGLAQLTGIHEGTAQHANLK